MTRRNLLKKAFIVFILLNASASHAVDVVFNHVSTIEATIGEDGIAIDSNDNTYSVGVFHKTADFDPGTGVANLVSASTDTGDVYISKLDSAGGFLWAKRVGGIGQDSANSVAVDSTGNVYFTGYFEGTVDFDPGVGVYNLVSAGNLDVYICKLDSSGNFVWVKSFGGSAVDEGLGVSVDSNGNVYTAGYFQAEVDFDAGAGVYSLTSAGDYDVFISKMDSLGNFLWAKKVGGSGADFGRSIALSPAGNVFVTGDFSSVVDFDPGLSEANLTSTGYSDIFVLQLNAQGEFVFAKKMGGIWDDYGYSIKLDSSGNIFTGGAFSQTADFDPGIGVSNLVFVGDHDAFINKLNADGSFAWAKQIGGVNGEFNYSLALNAGGSIYAGGIFQGTVDFDPNASTAYKASSGASYNAFILKLAPDTDGDGVGDDTDTDDDNDGVPDLNDAFPLNTAESIDTDTDGIGNNADPDDDNDTIPDVTDAFPLDAAESADTDSDGTGNNVDADDDNDGVPDANDAFPLNANEYIDTDSDGTGNNTDTDDDNDGVPDVSDPFPLVATESLDSDGDGLGNNTDNCPALANANQQDSDGDGLGDVCDSTPYGDTDGDGIDNLTDNCPSLANANQQDSDGDGKGNVCDPDNGGTAGVQVIGGQVFANGGDVIVKVMPASAGYTSELHLSSPGPDRFIALNKNVGMVVNLGSFPAGTELIFSIYVRNTGKTFFTGAANRNPDGLVHVAVETENSGLATVGFEDTFGGGDQDYNDNMFRFMGVNETGDLDNDGIGNNTDTDDDGDGWTDVAEAACGSNSLSIGSIPVDTDGDGTCNVSDADDDNDGVSDVIEAQLGTNPILVTNFSILSKDSDGDGMTDAMESTIGTNPNMSDVDSLCRMPLGGSYKGSVLRENTLIH